MLTLVAATMLSMAAAKADPLDAPRKAYNNCLIELHNKSVKDKVAQADFPATVDAACTAQRDAFKAAVVKSERSYGSNAKDAEEYASDEVKQIEDWITDAYKDNLDKNGILSSQ